MVRICFSKYVLRILIAYFRFFIAYQKKTEGGAKKKVLSVLRVFAGVASVMESGPVPVSVL